MDQLSELRDPTRSNNMNGDAASTAPILARSDPGFPNAWPAVSAAEHQCNQLTKRMDQLEKLRQACRAELLRNTQVRDQRYQELEQIASGRRCWQGLPRDALLTIVRHLGVSRRQTGCVCKELRDAVTLAQSLRMVPCTQEECFDSMIWRRGIVVDFGLHKEENGQVADPRRFLGAFAAGCGYDSSDEDLELGELRGDYTLDLSDAGHHNVLWGHLPSNLYCEQQGFPEVYQSWDEHSPDRPPPEEWMFGVTTKHKYTRELRVIRGKGDYHSHLAHLKAHVKQMTRKELLYAQKAIEDEEIRREAIDL